MVEAILNMDGFIFILHVLVYNECKCMSCKQCGRFHYSGMPITIMTFLSKDCGGEKKMLRFDPQLLVKCCYFSFLHGISRNAVILGQCGSSGPHNFPSQQLETHLLERISCLYADRHIELQSLWQETGENKWQKFHELSHMVSRAVDEIYRKVLEESRNQNLDIKDRVRTSEARLKEHMGSKALQVIAPVELPLLVRLKRNLACLKDLYDAKIDEDAQQSLVLTRLCNQVFSMREMLNLSPCVSTQLNEVLISATKVLGVFCSGTTASSQLIPEHHNEISPLFQLLYPLYRSLGAMEADFLFMKATRKVFETLRRSSETSIGLSLQDSREAVARKRSFDDQSALPTLTGNALKDSSPMPFGPKPHITVKESRRVRLLPDDSTTLEQLNCKILKKLERITNHLKCEVEQDSDMTEPDSLLFFQNAWTPSLERCTSINMSPLSDNFNAGAQMQALVSKRSSSHLCSSESSSSLLQDNSIVKCSQSRCELLDFLGQSNPTEAQQASEYERDLANSATMPPECCLKQSIANSSVSRLVSLPTTTKPDKEVSAVSCTGIKRLPLIPITNNQAAPGSTEKLSLQVLYPPPPPPPPPLPQHIQRPRAMPPPPPPPPSSSKVGVVKALQSHSTKLKKSATLSRLYMGMKKKAEGVALAPSKTVTDPTIQRRANAGTGTREGMAEALAEITKRSGYFRKIEDDVSMHASSILYVKSQLETFQTHDMNELVRFHRTIEAHLEQLTDESQVLARFDGFPVRKLETLRAAASLSIRLTSLMEQSQKWVVESPLSENFEKVVTFVDKVKGDIEAIERTKDEEMKRFTYHKIQFNFEMLYKIREAVVHLSSHCLALALKESQRMQKNATSLDEAYSSPSIKEKNKQRMSFQLMHRTFQLAYRVHNFAGGHDEMAEQLCSELACEMETYPPSFWLELAPKQ